MTRRSRRRAGGRSRSGETNRRAGILPYILVAVAIAVLATILIGPYLQSRDLAGAIPRRAEATIVSVHYASGRTRLGATNPIVVVRMDDREVQAIGLEALHGLRPGRRVLLTYLVGKSGQLYIQDVEPIATN